MREEGCRAGFVCVSMRACVRISAECIRIDVRFACAGTRVLVHRDKYEIQSSTMMARISVNQNASSSKSIYNM